MSQFPHFASDVTGVFGCPAIPAPSCPISARRQSESINNGSLGFQFPSFISVTSRGSTPYRRTIEAAQKRLAKLCKKSMFVEQRLHNEAEDVFVMIPHAER